MQWETFRQQWKNMTLVHTIMGSILSWSFEALSTYHIGSGDINSVIPKSIILKCPITLIVYMGNTKNKGVIVATQKSMILHQSSTFRLTFMKISFEHGSSNPEWDFFMKFSMYQKCYKIEDLLLYSLLFTCSSKWAKIFNNFVILNTMFSKFIATNTAAENI